MEIEDNTNQPRSKAPKTKSNPSLTSKSNGKHEKHGGSRKSSLDKITSNDLADSISHIEEMIQDIQAFSKRKTNVEICHYCQIQCEKQYLLRCTKADCLSYFCLRCLNQTFRISLMDIYMIMKSGAWSWSCPSCRGECRCQSNEHKTQAVSNHQDKKKVEEKPAGKINLSQNTTTAKQSSQNKKEKSKNHHPSKKDEKTLSPDTKSSPEEPKPEPEVVQKKNRKASPKGKENSKKPTRRPSRSEAQKKSSPVKEPSPEPEEPKIEPELEFNEKKNIKVSPKGKEKSERSTRRSKKSKDGVRVREKAQSPPQVESPIVYQSDPRMETRKQPFAENLNEVNEKKRRERKPKITRMSTRYSEKWAEINMTEKKPENKAERILSSKVKESKKSFQLELEKINSKKPTKNGSPTKPKLKKRDSSSGSEKSYQLEPEEEKISPKRSTKNLSPIKEVLKKRELSPEISEKFRKNEEINFVIKIGENMDEKISPSKTEELENLCQVEPEEEEKVNSKKSIKDLSPIKKAMKKRDSSPKEEKEDSKKLSKNTSPTKKKSKKLDQPLLIVEDDSKENEKASSKILSKKIFKKNFKKTGPQKARKKTSKKEQKKKEFERHWKADESEEFSARIKIDDKGDQQRMLTRSAEKVLPISKSVTAKSSESEGSIDDLFEIKGIIEAKVSSGSKESKDEWNKNGKRVLNPINEEEFTLEEEEGTDKAYYSYRTKSPEKQEDFLEKEEKLTIELSKCHYCVYLKLEKDGRTCCNPACRIFFCFACLRKHPEEESNKISDEKNWECLICEDRCTCIDCLEVLYKSKMGRKDRKNENKIVQECLDRARQIRNDNLIIEDLGLPDDHLEGYTLKKKKEALQDITNTMENKEKESESMILETKPVEEIEVNSTEMVAEEKENEPMILETKPKERTEMDLTEMIPEEKSESMILETKPIEKTEDNLTELLSEKNDLVAPDGIADVDECQLYLA